jgi:hypothetical protein
MVKSTKTRDELEKEVLDHLFLPNEGDLELLRKMDIEELEDALKESKKFFLAVKKNDPIFFERWSKEGREWLTSH